MARDAIGKEEVKSNTDLKVRIQSQSPMGTSTPTWLKLRALGLAMMVLSLCSKLAMEAKKYSKSEKLFACTNCHKRCKFEDLSSSQQLCKVGYYNPAGYATQIY